jgi:predicted Zn-dependent protease
MSWRLLRILLIAGFGLVAQPTSPALALDLDKINELLGTNLENLDKIRGKVSTEEEIEIGGNLIAGLLGASALVDNPRLQRYVNDVGFWVAAQSSRSKLPWRFGVLKSKGINAFAAPGGYIVITRGLYQLLENEAQLAAVLAHEIAHVVRKHHLKALQKTMKREFWSDLTVGVVSDKKDRKKMKKLINSGVQLYATGLDRRFEFEADRRGVVLVARAGYDPFAFLDVLTTIDSINPDSEELTVLMNTHPPTGDRLDTLARKMDGRLDSYASGVDNADRFRKVMARK